MDGWKRQRYGCFFNMWCGCAVPHPSRCARRFLPQPGERAPVSAVVHHRLADHLQRWVVLKERLILATTRPRLDAYDACEETEKAVNFVAIDFETANYEASSACSVGLVKVADGEIVDTAVHLIKPPTREFVFTHIHGLTWKDVAKAQDFGNLWPALEPFLHGAEFLAAHNASFDRSVLHACCERYNIAAPSLPFQCTVQLARRAWSIYPTKLPDVCRRLGIALDHHEALSDAMACARIVLAANKKQTKNVAARRRDDAPRPSAQRGG